MKIGILGCGPAGLSAALMLQNDGHDVFLFEQFDTPQVVGSGLMMQPTGLAVLETLGLAEPLKRLAHRIDVMEGHLSSNQRCVLSVNFTTRLEHQKPYGIHRGALFKLLYDEVIARAVPIRTSFLADGLRQTSEGVRVTSKNGEDSAPFDFVIDATGRHSRLLQYAIKPSKALELPYGALWASIPAPEGFATPPHHLSQIYEGARVMIGVLPLGRRYEGDSEQVCFFWNFKPADYAHWKAQGMDAWKAEVLRHWPFVAPLLDQLNVAEDLVLARYGHHTLPKPFGERVVFIGDAAHATSPQLGQGANMALLDAYALALSLRQHQDIAKAFECYAKLRGGHVRLYQAMSRVFTPFYQSDSRVLPVVRDAIFPLVYRLPGAQMALTAMVGGAYGWPLQKLGLRTGSMG